MNEHAANQPPEVNAVSNVGAEAICHTPEQTMALGHALGQQLEKPMVLLLKGDLGSGKTCFVRGLARGLAVPPVYDITSPTYTLIHEYPGRIPLYHIDLYRIEDPVDMAGLGLEDILYEDAVVAVEWADRLPVADRPPIHLELVFCIQSDESRRIRITAYGLGDDDLIMQRFFPSS